ncbi:MAG: ABC transporter permease [Rhodospirillaceae bacterium]
MMKLLPLLWAGLWRKPLRTTLTMLTLIVTFLLFGLMQGINAGFEMLREASRPDGLYVNSRFGPPLPMAYREQIAALPGVRAVTALAFLGGPVNGDQARILGVGMADDGFFDFFRWIDISPAQIEQLRATRNGIVIGENTATRLGIKAGDRVTIKSLPTVDGSDWTLDVLTVVGRKDISGFAGITIGNYEFFNEQRAQGKDRVNQFLVLMSDEKVAVQTAKAIDTLFENSAAPTYTTVDRENLERQQDDSTTDAMVNATVLGSLFALLLMISSTMTQSFRERTAEFGVLKAIGFGDRQVLGLVMAEAMIPCLLGAVVGLGLARLLEPYTKSLISGQATATTVSWGVIGAGLGVAGLVAAISAAGPAWRAGRMAVVDALAR